MDIEEYLESYGLEGREVRIYLILLEVNGATASTLSKKSNILRQTVYEVIDKLIHRGLVKYTKKNNIRWFEAVNPDRLNAILLEKQEIVKKILPELKKLQGKNTGKQSVSIYEGVGGLKTIYNRIIKDSPKEILEYGNSKCFIEAMKFYFVQNYMRKRIANKTKLRLITEPGKKIEKLYGTNKRLFRETKFNALIKDIQTASYIYGDIFILISFGEDPQGIIIEDKSFVNTQRIIFEMMWGAK